MTHNAHTTDTDMEEDMMQSSRQQASDAPVLFVTPGSKQFFLPPPLLQQAEPSDDDEGCWNEDDTTFATSWKIPREWEPTVLEIDEQGMLTVTLAAVERPTATSSSHHDQRRGSHRSS